MTSKKPVTIKSHTCPSSHKITMGMKTARNIGVLYAIVAKPVTSGHKQKNQLLTFSGRVVSRMSISLLHLLIILPSGVVSKNDIGARIRRETSREWNTREALVLPKARATDPIITAITDQLNYKESAY